MTLGKSRVLETRYIHLYNEGVDLWPLESFALFYLLGLIPPDFKKEEVAVTRGPVTSQMAFHIPMSVPYPN